MLVPDIVTLASPLSTHHSLIAETAANQPHAGSAARAVDPPAAKKIPHSMSAARTTRPRKCGMALAQPLFEDLPARRFSTLIVRSCLEADCSWHSRGRDSLQESGASKGRPAPFRTEASIDS